MARSKAAGRAKKQQPTQNAKKAIVCSVCGKGDGKYKCPKCRSPFCCVQCSKDHKANHCPATKSNETGDDDVSKQQQSDNTAAAATSTAVAKVGSSSTANEPQSKYLPPAAFAQAASSLQKKKRKRRSTHDDDDSDIDEPGWNISAEMKQLVQRSEWLRKELEDGGLRHLIEQIDAASDDDDDGEEDNNSNKRKKNWGRNGQHNNKNGNTDISQRVLALARTKHSHPKFASFIDRLLVTAGVLLDGGGGNGEASLFEGGGGGGLRESGRLELVPVPRRGGELLIAAAGGKVESRSADEDSGSDEESDSSSDEDDSDGSSTE